MVGDFLVWWMKAERSDLEGKNLGLMRGDSWRFWLGN